MAERRFTPKPGQIDFTNTPRAPVVNCVVRYGDRFLVVKRSAELSTYPGLWNGVSGFLDDGKTPVEKAREEVWEELGLAEEDIVEVRECRTLEIEDAAIQKTWIVHPMLVRVRTDRVRLDWEASEHRWIRPEELESLVCTPGLDRIFRAATGQS